jgi:hypothetical protein
MCLISFLLLTVTWELCVPYIIPISCSYMGIICALYHSYFLRLHGNYLCLISFLLLTVTWELFVPYIIPISYSYTVYVFVYPRDSSFVGCCVVQSVDFVCFPLLVWSLVSL